MAREISLYVLLGHLLIAGVGSLSCVPAQCLKCNVTGQTQADRCITNTTSSCIKDFEIFINSTESKAEEGDTITLICVHDIPLNLTLKFVWMKDKENIAEGQNKSKLVLEKVLSHNAGKYACQVESKCGTYTSSPHDVSVNNNGVLLLVICGVSAVVLVVILGLAMKFKLKRDNAKHKERMKQRAQAEQRGGPAPFTPRES